MTGYVSPMRHPRLTLLQPLESGGSTTRLLPTTDLDLARLDAEITRLRGEGDRICRLLGMTSDWATTRWAAGERPSAVVASYTVRVHGESPTPEVTRGLTRRLARQGWVGKVLSEGSTLRIEAVQGDLSMRLVAHDRRVTLRVNGPQIEIGRPHAKALLAGVFEDDVAS
ncbi:hypothetical protein C8046_02280 [Serinibacter arcticus]|uniref:Uncharacterized protein n=1 Tax=Serinibacter arcticus TaxID=1655435 RepID=A0A2U1ZRT7_9MICO|nr:hypothetical protein [Serinibacter arcticus]PWD49705.1 hypothetical protein C8046_02280 [Serinibacter arcticus]